MRSGCAEARVALLALTLAATVGCAGAGPTGRGARGSTAMITRERTAPRTSSPPADQGTLSTSRTVVPGDADWRREYRNRSAIRTLEGQVSYYHDSLAGRSTASGEPYDPRAFTAANRELPFGTVIRVTRLDTGASVIVRVNDRGPFGRRQRILDLSRAAAEELGMIHRGVAQVRAEILELGEPPARRRRRR
jgi:rare lipoprotein A